MGQKVSTLREVVFSKKSSKKKSSKKRSRKTKKSAVVDNIALLSPSTSTAARLNASLSGLVRLQQQSFDNTNSFDGDEQQFNLNSNNSRFRPWYCNTLPDDEQTAVINTQKPSKSLSGSKKKHSTLESNYQPEPKRFARYDAHENVLEQTEVENDSIEYPQNQDTAVESYYQDTEVGYSIACSLDQDTEVETCNCACSLNHYTEVERYTYACLHHQDIEIENYTYACTQHQASEVENYTFECTQHHVSEVENYTCECTQHQASEVENYTYECTQHQFSEVENYAYECALHHVSEVENYTYECTQHQFSEVENYAYACTQYQSSEVDSYTYDYAQSPNDGDQTYSQSCPQINESGECHCHNLNDIVFADPNQEDEVPENRDPFSPVGLDLIPGSIAEPDEELVDNDNLIFHPFNEGIIILRSNVTRSNYTVSDDRVVIERAIEIEEGIDPPLGYTPGLNVQLTESTFPNSDVIGFDYIPYLVPGLLQIIDSPFYWGQLDRHEAEQLLENKPEGTYLLRDSIQENYLFSVSFRKYQRSLHARIEQWGGLFTFDAKDPKLFAAPTVCELLEHYKHPKNCMFYEPMLSTPLNRNFMFSLLHRCRAVICDQIKFEDIEHLNLPKQLKTFLKEYHFNQRVKVRRHLK